MNVNMNYFFLSFAAKQPLVYLNLEFCDKYIDVIFRNWVQFSFLILFQMKSSSSSEFHWKQTMIVEIVC